jgi:hypothetical protein
VSDLQIASNRSPDLDDAEARRRLGRVYAIILNFAEQRNSVDRGDFGFEAHSDEEATTSTRVAPT